MIVLHREPNILLLRLCRSLHPRPSSGSIPGRQNERRITWTDPNLVMVWVRQNGKLSFINSVISNRPLKELALKGWFLQVLFCDPKGSMALRKGEVSAYVGLSQNLKDLKEGSHARPVLLYLVPTCVADELCSFKIQ